MKFDAVLLVAAGLASATAASAATAGITSDMDYLKASRCRGIAAGVGADTSGIDAALRTEGRARAAYIQSRAYNEMVRAKRQTADANQKDKLEAELNGPCMAYLGSGNTNVANR